MPRNYRSHPEERVCNVCNELKNRSEYKITSKKTGAYLYTCKICRNIKEGPKRTARSKRYYWSLTPEQRKIKAAKNTLEKRERLKNPEVRARYDAYYRSDDYVYKNYIKRCKKPDRIRKGIKMELSYEQFTNLINKPCNYCGIENCRGVDRIDSNLSYSLDNSRPCCGTCNMMKNDMNVDDFKSHISKINKFIEVRDE